MRPPLSGPHGASLATTAGITAVITGVVATAVIAQTPPTPGWPATLAAGSSAALFVAASTLYAARNAIGLALDHAADPALGGYWAGFVLVELRQFKEAIKELTTITFPANADPLPAMAKLKQGEALEQLGQWKAALDIYNRLGSQPPSAERDEARTRAQWIEKNVPKEMRK
ncbi:MAG: tetratricopeptide repeat protein [Candidatus Sericytochromatia bacterium]